MIQLVSLPEFKSQRVIIVQEAKQNRLDAKFKKMLKQHDEAETKRRQPVTRPGVGNIIRRRKGEKDKRFFSNNV